MARNNQRRLLERIEKMLEAEIDNATANQTNPVAATNTTDNNNNQNDTTQPQGAPLQGMALKSKADVDKMTDAEAIYNAFMNKNQDGFDQAGKSALRTRVNNLTQKSQTGSISDKERDEIIQGIIAANSNDNQ